MATRNVDGRARQHVRGCVAGMDGVDEMRRIRGERKRKMADARMTRKRMAALQSQLVRFNVGFTRSQREHGEFIFSLLRLPECVLSPVCPMIRCGLELVEQAERNPSSIAAKLYSLVLDGESIEIAAF